MKSLTVKIGLILLILTGFNSAVYSQRAYPDILTLVSNGESDYQTVISYWQANIVECPDIFTWDRISSLEIYKDNMQTPYKTIQAHDIPGSSKVYLETGPNLKGNWGIRYREYTSFSDTYLCDKWVWSGFPPSDGITFQTGYNNLTFGGTAPIFSPGLIKASKSENLDKIILTWGKGSMIPDSLNIDGKGLKQVIQYRIYRGTTKGEGTLVATVPASVFSWTDHDIVPNDTLYYWVTTYTTNWGGHESVRNGDNAVMGTAKTIGLKASDGLYTNRVKLDWNDLSSFADGIRVERSIPDSTGREELALLSKYARTFNDQDAIPGYGYTYFITPTHPDHTCKTESDKGYCKPDGRITGYVKSLMGTGVTGVSVCARPLSTPRGGAQPVPQEGYCAITDQDGYYEIRNIYYFDSTKFVVVPRKSGPAGEHAFEPEALSRILDIDSKVSTGVNFTDQSVFTVAGRITFPVSSTKITCGVEDAEILINGESRSIFTDVNGDWSYAIQEEGRYTFKPVFHQHTFRNVHGESDTTLLVSGDSDHLDFTDTKVDSIQVRVQSGCGDALGDSARVQVTADGTCYQSTFRTDAHGLLNLRNLPARKYRIMVVGLWPVNSNVMDQIGNKPIDVDLTERDTADIITTRDTMTITPSYYTQLPDGSILKVPADTTYTTVADTTREEVIPRAEFIYHSPIRITVDFEAAGAEVFPGCKNNEGESMIVMDQGVNYKLVFNVSEELGGCPVKEGKLRIFDDVSDRYDLPVEIPIVNGKATYMANPGLPKIAVTATHKHQKLLYILPEVGFLDSSPVEYWIMVAGVKTQAPSFITRSPEFPMLILHDPPGDKSSAFVEKGTEFKYTHASEEIVGGEGGIYLNVIFGFKIKTFFSEHGFGLNFKLASTSGRDNLWRDGYETTLSFTEKFSTSDMEELTGADGDVYIGASFNQEYALGDELTFDKASCQAVIRTVPTVDYTGFATTFIYTEKHIKSSLLPTLGLLRSALIAGRTASQLTDEEKIQANQFLYDSLHWENVLAKNRANRDSNSVFKSNVSFSAGAPYSNEYTSGNKTTDGFEYNRFVNIETALGIKAQKQDGSWFDNEAGITAKFRYSYKINNQSETSATRKVGYTLDDGDVGDFFSVDIKEDTAFRVPAFDLKLGTTSCPHEEGTQPRDDAKIQIFPPQINNVPIGGKALFTANLLNQSQSRETRDYAVRVIPTTNPDGAIVTIGGEQINNGEAVFSLKYNQTTTIALTVEKGPLATNYDSIGIVIYPPCEYEQGEVTSGDTAWIYVNFESECSNVALHLPGNGWLVNKNNNNILNVAFTGYDLNNEYLESITLQYRKEGQGWIDYRTVMKAQLQGFFYDLDFNVSALSDGAYSLRAKAWCGIEGGYSYSSEQAGIIDRTSVSPFGMPSPADGFLRPGQEISVTFDKDIDCDFSSYNPSLPAVTIKLFKKDSTEIPITVQCSENQDRLILVPVVDLFSQPALEGIRLYALVQGIRDISGNVQEYPTKWSFLVNVSPVSWNPDELSVSAEAGKEVVIRANLDNDALLSKPFLISEWPEWCVPAVTSASILPGNSFGVDLKVADNLLPGMYSGQVIALIDNVPEILKVTLALYAKDIDWAVNPPDYEYKMNITAQFSSDEGDINLSANQRDKIAAYINGELRGVGNISRITELGTYAAFINVYSNQAGSNGSLLEGENYVADLSVQKITVTDNGVTSGATRFRKSNWIDFDIYATKDGNHRVEFRVASLKPATGAQLLIDGILKTTLPLSNTGNLSSYTTLSTTVNISKGKHKLRILSTDAEFDLNWLNFPEYHVRNQHSGEIIKFRMWDGLRGIAYGAVEELTFFQDGSVGSARVPFILHPEGGIQDTPLAKGWTWISLNKVKQDMGLASVFESITPLTSKNDITLKSQTAYSQFSQITGWQGNLTTINPRLGYMIHLNNHPDTLSVIGVTPDTITSLNLSPKWNWIGYPRSVTRGVNDVLSHLTASRGDLLISQSGFAGYDEISHSWMGNLEYFQPGKGYKLFLTSGNILDLLKSTSAGNLDRKHEFNMTITAAIKLGSLDVSDELYLQTWINGQLRGVVPLNYVDAIGENMAFIMVYGDRADVGEKVNVLLWDENLGKSMPLTGEEIRFGIDLIKGTIRNPVLLSMLDPGTGVNGVNETGIFTIFPNPFSGMATIGYSISGKTHVSLIINNAMGAEVQRIVDLEQPAGYYEYTIRADGMASGIYYCTLRTDNDIKTRKILLNKK